VQMRHRFARVRTVVDHNTKTGSQVQLRREEGGHRKEVSDHCFVARCKRGDSWNQFFRYNQQVDGCLRVDVVEHNASIVLVFDLCGNLAVDDFLEDRFGHEKFCSWGISGSSMLPQITGKGAEGWRCGWYGPRRVPE